MTGGRLLTFAAVAGAAALVWSASGELAWPTRAWTAALLALLPPLMVAQAAMLPRLGDVPRSSIYLSSVVSLWLLAAVTLVVVFAGGPALDRVGLRAAPLPATLAWTGGITAGGLLLMAMASRLGLRESPFLWRLLPRTRSEKVQFVGVSITAGICEELVFRGFLIAALQTATGSLTLAVALSSGVFGVLHAYQRAAGALRAAALGALLAMPLLQTGSLLPSMIAHAAIDILAGLWLRDVIASGHDD
jgi:membrane protease YdiL (CAAX protease family)